MPKTLDDLLAEVQPKPTTLDVASRTKTLDELIAELEAPAAATPPTEPTTADNFVQANFSQKLMPPEPKTQSLIDRLMALKKKSDQPGVAMPLPEVPGRMKTAPSEERFAMTPTTPKIAPTSTASTVRPGQMVKSEGRVKIAGTPKGYYPEINGQDGATPITEFEHGALHAILPYLNEEQLALAFPTKKSAWDFAGEFAGSVIPFSALGKMTAGIRILKAIQGAPLMANIARGAVRGGLEMGAYSLAGEAFQDKPIGEKATNVLIGAGMGTVLGGGAEALGSLIPKKAATAADLAKSTVTLKPTDKIGKITVKEATERLAVGDKSVLPEIAAGVKQYGQGTIQDQVINKATKVVSDNAKTVGYEQAQAGIKKIAPEIKAVVNPVPAQVPVVKTPDVAPVAAAGRKALPIEQKLIAEPIHNIKQFPELGQKIQQEANTLAGELSLGEAPQLIQRGESFIRTKSSNPAWFTELGKSKKEIYSAIEKIKKDQGADKGPTVERVKALIVDRLKSGVRDKNLPPVPPDEGFVNGLVKANSWEEFNKAFVLPKGGKKPIQEFSSGVPGLAAGFEQETDENGKLTGRMKFNPGKAAIGFGLSMGGQRLFGAKPGKPIQEPPKPVTAVDRVIQALKEAKPVRGQQARMYSEERAKQVARIVAMGKKVPGQQGFYAQLGQLKGALKKVEFESIKNKVTQADIDALFQTVETHGLLTPFEKITAKGGLEKLVGAKGGTVPTKGEIALLSEVFPPEFIESVMGKQSLMAKLWHEAGGALNLPRAVMATADLSAPLRQGIFLVGRPKQWGPAFRDMFKYAFSEKAYQGLAKDIQSRTNYKLMREAKLALTDLGANMAKREEAFMSTLAEKIPVFGRMARGSNRAYSGFLNKLRADVFDDLVKAAKQTGVFEQRPEVIHDIAKFVNSATGRGELGGLDRAAVTLNGAFFSPRLMASRLNLLNPAYYVKLDPFVRKEALKSLFTFAGAAATVLGLAKLGGASVGTDPRSADFAKIKVGNTRFDILGGFQQYIVLASRLLTNQMVSSTTGKAFNLGEGYKPTTRADIIQRFFESKTSPVGSFVLQMVRGKTSGGDDVDVPVEITNRFIPMVTQDMYDLYKEYGLPGLAIGTPGMFGVGSQTYGEQIPLASRTALGKPTIKWAQRPGLAEDIVNKMRGVKVEPVAVKATYDRAQALVKEGKTAEAQALVNGLSKNDYELYKKFKQRDNKIQADEVKVRIEPVYKQIQQLKDQGDMAEAQKMVDALTPDEYKAYSWFRETDYKRIEP
jgi:hypothetical protein